MARSLRGWIRNLADGLGPPPGSVGVAATVLDSDDTQDLINQTTHATGPLTYVHAAGSGDATLADGGGHFGWDMEFSPGRITQQVVPTDPQTEYRWRYPDESAQIGKAYHSDLERLAWTGGRDALVWNAIPGGADPTTAQWGTDPTATAQLGNWSISAFAENMGFSLRRGIAFVGGTVFSIEAGDLAFPYAGVSAAAPNATAQDRWDVVYLKVVTDPAAYNYGKQEIEVITGTPGGGIPVHAGQPTNPVGRRLALHALKVPANSSAYNQAVDMRRWLWLPVQPIITVDVEYITTQGLVTDGLIPSVLNTQLAANELKLPMGQAFAGEIDYSCSLTASLIVTRPDQWDHVNLKLAPGVEGYDVRGELVMPAGHVLTAKTYHMINGPQTMWGSEVTNIHIPIPRIPSYHVDAGVNVESPRVWHRMRPALKYAVGALGTRFVLIGYQRAVVRLWPLP